MANWIDVCDETHFPVGSYQVFAWNGLSLLVFNIHGEFYALENRCTHEDQTLDGGDLDGEEIICPWHGAGFCVKTGLATRDPGYGCIKTFPVRCIAGKIQIQLADSN
jgi:3-phenylpropionate/trans-cinnamate dioxygenase ferredoxin component